MQVEYDKVFWPAGDDVGNSSISSSLPKDNPMYDHSEPDEENWCNNERMKVIKYLHGEGVLHRGVGDWPAWHIWPYVAVWAVQSLKSPGWVGWWAISGDLPTDYTGCGPERHPRTGLRDIANRWKAAAEKWSKGEPVEGLHIGNAEHWPTLAPLLANRAELLLSYATDGDLWVDE